MNEMLVTMIMVGYAVLAAGFIGALLIILNRVMKKMEMEAILEKTKNQILPAVEDMSVRTVNRMMDETMDKTVKMVEKLAEEQKKAYDF